MMAPGARRKRIDAAKTPLVNRKDRKYVACRASRVCVSWSGAGGIARAADHVGVWQPSSASRPSWPHLHRRTVVRLP